MKERKNIIQKLVEKPKQAVINLATMVKTRWDIGQERINQGKIDLETFLSTPPAEKQPTTQYFDTKGMCSFFDYSQKYIFDPESKRWNTAPAERDYFYGGGMH